MALIAFVVFGPARRRLRQVQDATERLGGGDLDGARARAGRRRSRGRRALVQPDGRRADGARARRSSASDKARRQLLADVSHELMTPLTAMRGYVETLTMPELELDAETRQRYLGIVTEETHRLERIIGDLLDLARLEGGGTAMRQEPVDVAALFERVAERHERELRARAHHARAARGQRRRTASTAIPTASSRRCRIWPPTRCGTRRMAARLRLTAERTEAGVRITVRDTGPGIAAEHLPLIFDRFYKVDVSRKATGGSGLGLSIVKAIVERHGGTIAAYNDNGAVFEIVLPGASSVYGLRSSVHCSLRSAVCGLRSDRGADSVEAGFSRPDGRSIGLREADLQRRPDEADRDVRRPLRRVSVDRDRRPSTVDLDRSRRSCEAHVTRASSRADTCPGGRTL